MIFFNLLTRSRTSLKAFHTSIPFILPFDHNGTRTDAKIARWRFRIFAQYQIGAVQQKQQQQKLTIKIIEIKTFFF